MLDKKVHKMNEREAREEGGRKWQKGLTHLRSLVVAQRWHVTAEDRTVGHSKILVPPERGRTSKRDDKIECEI